MDNGGGVDLHELLHRNSDVVRILRHPHTKDVAAEQYGNSCCPGTVVAFLDDDDVWAPSKLCSQVAAAETQCPPKIPVIRTTPPEGVQRRLSGTVDAPTSSSTPSTPSGTRVRSFVNS